MQPVVELLLFGDLPLSPLQCQSSTHVMTVTGGPKTIQDQMHAMYSQVHDILVPLPRQSQPYVKQVFGPSLCDLQESADPAQGRIDHIPVFGFDIDCSLKTFVFSW